jgi:glucose 1-dehydrogenase
MNVSEKVAIVTGASSGVGAQTAVKLAAMRAKVVVNYATSAPGVKDTLARGYEAGGRLSVFRLMLVMIVSVSLW